ncbi:M48 family metallopeptidase [Thermodesulfobacteriota bacterium]
MKYTARMPETNVNVTPASPLRDFFVLLSAVAGIIVGIYLLLGLAVDFIVPRLSPEIEQKIGGVFLNSMAGSDTSPEKTKTVQMLLDKIQEQSAKLPYKLTVHLNDSPVVNAVALPGGNIIVFSGLLEKMESENELAFVLAHEIGHYSNRDHLRGLGRALVFIMISTTLFGAESNIGNLLAQSLNITEMGFSRNQESHADEFALEVLNRCYGHVGGATDFFKKLSVDKKTSRMKHYFSTHPESLKRIAHLISYSRSKGFAEKSLRKLSSTITEKKRDL